jgi:hypothetical protein
VLTVTVLPPAPPVCDVLASLITAMVNSMRYDEDCFCLMGKSDVLQHYQHVLKTKSQCHAYLFLRSTKHIQQGQRSVEGPERLQRRPKVKAPSRRN